MSFVRWVLFLNPTAAPLLTISSGFATRRPIYEFMPV